MDDPKSDSSTILVNFFHLFLSFSIYQQRWTHFASSRFTICLKYWRKNFKSLLAPMVQGIICTYFVARFLLHTFPFPALFCFCFIRFAVVSIELHLEPLANSSHSIFTGCFALQNFIVAKKSGIIFSAY